MQKKTFDRMNHFALYIKLMNRSVPVLMLSVLEHWFSFCISCVKSGSAMSYFYELTRGQSNLTKSASRGAHSPVTGHPRGSKVVPLNSWGRVSY